jgi:hypothetical protein
MSFFCSNTSGIPETILERVPGGELTMGVYCIEGLAFEVK